MTGCCDQQGGPTAFVRLTICPESDCRRDGVRGMVRLIKAGDRADDQTIISRRTVCRECEHRVRRGARDICGADRLALHWRTAVGSYQCEHWNKEADA